MTNHKIKNRKIGNPYAQTARPYVVEMVKDWDAVLVTEDEYTRKAPKDGNKFSLQEIESFVGPNPQWGQFKELGKVWRVYTSADEPLDLLIIQHGRYQD